jgi:hypothetical protein
MRRYALQLTTLYKMMLLLLQTKIYCTHHAAQLEGAVLIKADKFLCSNETCSKEANFGYEGKDAMYCKTCIPKGLKSELVDVKNKRCEHEGCRTRPSFGYKTDGVSNSDQSSHYSPQGILRIYAYYNTCKPSSHTVRSTLCVMLVCTGW